MSASVFDDLTDVYEAMIDWPARLEREGPFYRRLVETLGVRRVLDAACGTGRHAAMLHSWGLAVEAADVSPRMLDRARASFGQPQGLQWRLRGFDQPIAAAEPFDLVLCVGNSLGLAPDREGIGPIVANLLAAVRPGGALVVQVLNLWRLADGPSVWQKCKRAELAGREALIVKGLHRAADRGFVDLLVIDPAAQPPRLQADTAAFWGLEGEELAAMARQAGAVEVRLYGGYQEQPYDREKSVDLVMVARAHA